MEIYKVRFSYKGTVQSQSIQAEVANEGHPLRYKSIIDSAIEGWMHDNKIERKSTKIINIEVANSNDEIVARQGDFNDYQSIT